MNDSFAVHRIDVENSSPDVVALVQDFVAEVDSVAVPGIVGYEGYHSSSEPLPDDFLAVVSVGCNSDHSDCSSEPHYSA